MYGNMDGDTRGRQLQVATRAHRSQHSTRLRLADPTERQVRVSGVGEDGGVGDGGGDRGVHDTLPLQREGQTRGDEQPTCAGV